MQFPSDELPAKVVVPFSDKKFMNVNGINYKHEE
jgi:hypothetical protein